MGAHFEKLRDLVAAPPYDALLFPVAAALGPAALPTQRTMLQEVVVVAGAEGGAAPGTRRFVWWLGMQTNG